MRNRRRTSALLLLVSSSTVALPRLVHAQARAREGVDVAWTAPAECPSSDELQQRVTSRVPADAAVRARGRAEKHGGRYRLSLEITTASSRGERAIDASTCDALASSAAVVIAMSVAPPAERAREREREEEVATSASDEAAPAGAAPAVASTPPPAPSTAPPPAPVPSPRDRPDRPREAPSPARRSDASPRLFVRAEAAGEAGLLPSAALGGGLAIGVVLLRDLALEASAQLYAAQDATIDGSAQPARGATFGLLTGGGRACWALTRGIELSPCVGLVLARTTASGFGALKVSDADTLTWGPEALLAARMPIAGPVALRAGIGAFVPMSRQSFVINAAGTVHEPQAVALRTFLGPEVRF